MLHVPVLLWKDEGAQSGGRRGGGGGGGRYSAVLSRLFSQPLL